MIIRACKYLLYAGGISVCLYFLGLGLTVLLDGKLMASRFTEAWFSTFNGLVVGATGYGLLLFIVRERHPLEQALRNAFDVPDEFRPEFVVRLARVLRWRLRTRVTALITAVGGFILINAGIPLEGFAHIYLSVAVVSYYLIGGYMLMILIAIMGVFDFVSDHSAPNSGCRIGLRHGLRSLEMKTIDSYVIITSMFGLVAIYVAFRTTLTAFPKESPYYGWMILPLFFFVPATLVYSFYPRFVLREVWDCDTEVVLDKMTTATPIDESTDIKTRLETRKLLMEVKEKMAEERTSVPLLRLKDAPTLTLAAFTAIQFFVQKDPVLIEFFKQIFRW